MQHGRKPRKGDIAVTIYQLMVLLTNFCNANSDPDIGYNDADRPLSDVLSRYKSAHLNMSLRDLEDLLYSSNMLNEDKKFWHPTGESFDKFTYDVARSYKFDKQYNRLTPRSLLPPKVTKPEVSEEVED